MLRQNVEILCKLFVYMYLIKELVDITYIIKIEMEIEKCGRSILCHVARFLPLLKGMRWLPFTFCFRRVSVRGLRSM